MTNGKIKRNAEAIDSAITRGPHSRQPAIRGQCPGTPAGIAGVVLGYKLVPAKAGSRMPHQHVPVADNAEATGGVSEATKTILARGACSFASFSCTSKKRKLPAGARPGNVELRAWITGNIRRKRFAVPPYPETLIRRTLGILNEIENGNYIV